MIWFPSGPEVFVGPGRAGSAGFMLSAWRSPAGVTRVWFDEGWARWDGDDLPNSKRMGTVIEIEASRYFYPGLTVESFLEVMAEAWAQRGGR